MALASQQNTWILSSMLSIGMIKTLDVMFTPIGPIIEFTSMLYHNHSWHIKLRTAPQLKQVVGVAPGVSNKSSK
jgi:hypothetical protein